MFVLLWKNERTYLPNAGSSSCSANPVNPPTSESATAVVVVNLTLGVSPDKFGVKQQGLVELAIAEAFGLSPSVVSIISVENASSRRVATNSDEDETIIAGLFTNINRKYTEGFSGVDSFPTFKFGANSTLYSSVQDPANTLTYSENGGKNRRAYSASRILAQLSMPTDDCSFLQSNRASISGAIQSRLQEWGLSPQYQISLVFYGCPVTEVVSESQLAPDLRYHATSTTIVVATVVTAVVSTSVASATAGAVGMSVFSSGASAAATPGASIYQLIFAVQFMNLFGAMLETRGSSSSNSRRMVRDLAQSNKTTENISDTSSQAAEFR